MRPSLIACLILLCGLLAMQPIPRPAQAMGPHLPVDPASPGPCVTSTLDIQVGGALQVVLYYPDADLCGTLAAPYPGVVLAHGFSMFGLSNGARENSGNGAHVASWGYVVAIPSLPDDFQTRMRELGAVVDYLQSAASDPASPLYRRVDGSRLGVVGHSLGGASALALAGRDPRIRAVVALDPVYHGGMPGSLEEVWNPQPDMPNIACPTLILGSPPSSCNADADYARLYPLLKARPRASVLITGASHCVFAVPGSSYCVFFCGGTSDTGKSALSQRYMTAWLNEMLHQSPDYHHFLLGEQANLDASQGLIVRQLDLVLELPLRTWLPVSRAR